MLKKTDNSLIENILKEARKSERKRYIHCFHKPEERLQRMINAGLKDSYARPHKHENPDKLEIFSILKGVAAVIMFDGQGKIADYVILDENGHNKIVEIPPKAWHNFVIISDEAVLYEIIEGEYDSKTHKKFAPWAPEEDSEGVKEYLSGLKREVLQ